MFISEPLLQDLIYFLEAMDYSTLTHDLYFITIDNFFMAGDYNGAIEAINKASAEHYPEFYKPE